MTNKKQKDFLKLYEPIHDRFERFCRARVYGKLDYQDLMNDTLLLAFEKIDSLRSEKAFLSFLIGISVRILSNHHKKRKEKSIFEDENDRWEDLNAKTDLKTEVYYLHRAMAELPDVQKEAVILFEISGFSIKEIMEIQTASESAVKQRLKRGRTKLIEILNYESIQKKEVKHG